MTSPRVWVTAAPAGGRSALGAPLAEAFRRIGCEAAEMSLALLQRTRVPVIEDPNKAWVAAVAEFWTRVLAEKPDLIVDLSPLPAELIRRARERGVKTAYWLMEDGLNPAYAYWKAAAPDYDLFFTFQGEPFSAPGCRYLPWGAAANRPACAVSPGIVLHGTYSVARAAWLGAALEAVGGEHPFAAIGPGWSRFDSHRARTNLRIDDRWTSLDEMMDSVAGRIVLIPLSDRTNAIPPRLWDSLASGGCVVAQTNPLIAATFTDGEHLLACSTPEEAGAACCRLIADAPLRDRIAQAGRAMVLQRHMLEHRAKEILEISSR